MEDNKVITVGYTNEMYGLDIQKPDNKCVIYGDLSGLTTVSYSVSDAVTGLDALVKAIYNAGSMATTSREVVMILYTTNQNDSYTYIGNNSTGTDDVKDYLIDKDHIVITHAPNVSFYNITLFFSTQLSSNKTANFLQLGRGYNTTTNICYSYTASFYNSTTGGFPGAKSTLAITPQSSSFGPTLILINLN